MKDPFRSKYQLLIKGKEKAGIKYEKIQKHSLIIHEQQYLKFRKPIQQRKVLLEFENMIADLEANKKLSLSFSDTELFFLYRNPFSSCLKIHN